ncbi:hypothetical protein MnTg04_01278 [bacterium MnTg04]|nr:hypothetical protein MnTg04_01278 [bacterium MnTg04]
MIAQRADHRVALLVDQERRGALDRGPLDRLPDPHQVIEIPSQFFVAAADAGRADDNAHSRVDVQLSQGIADQVAVFAGDPAGHAPGARVIGHQDDEATGQADKGGQRRTLGAAFDFLDLNDDLLALAEHILDIDARPRLWVLHEVFARNLLEREEAMALGPVFYKCRFEAGLDAGYFSFVDIGFFLFPAGDLYIKIV